MEATLPHSLDAPDWLVRELAATIDRLDKLEQELQQANQTLAGIVDRLIEPKTVDARLDVVRELWPAP